jgi:16S rRNA (cytosine967-C5)-methyltransferase
MFKSRANRRITGSDNAMTPGARVSAAIECLDAIFEGAPAEKALTGWARRSRFAGSKDRAAVRDHVFDALRQRDTYAGLGGGLTGRCVMIGLVTAQGLVMDQLFDGQGHAPEPLTELERQTLAGVMPPVEKASSDASEWCWDMPDWCAQALERTHPDQAKQIADALKRRAPVDIRLNFKLSTMEDAIRELAADGIEVEPCDIAKSALRVTQNPRKVKLSDAYLSGKVELQDAGSQALIEALPLKEARTILDYCAGGGGKALAISAICDAKIYAHDIDAARMKDIPVRAERAETLIRCLETSALSNQGPFDLVLCDAPCSGSGAWRRSPDAKWRFTQERFDELLDIQNDILRKAHLLVAPGGFLVFATCSLFSEENEDQVNGFQKEHPAFSCIHQKSWTPLDGCDGFFAAILQLKG